MTAGPGKGERFAEKGSGVPANEATHRSYPALGAGISRCVESKRPKFNELSGKEHRLQ